MTNSKKWVPLFIAIIIILVAAVFYMFNTKKENLSRNQTHYDNDKNNSELNAEYTKALEKLDVLTTYVNSIQTKEFQEVKSVDISNMGEQNTCSFSEIRPLSSLNSGSDKFFYIIDNSKKFDFNLLGLGNVNLGKHEKIGIVDYIEYKDTSCNISGVKSNIRLAAGVRLELDIVESNNKLGITTPSKIAAAMELNLAKVTYHIRTIGFKTDSTRKILADIEDQGDFNVKSYVRVINALNKIMATMNDSLLVNPEVVPY